MNALAVVGAGLKAVAGPDREPSFLVAVSGGSDSVALLDLLVRQTARYRLRLGVAHVNYRLRGADSEEDALFVNELAASYGLPFFLRALSDEEAARLGPTGIQEKARRVRFRFFDEVGRREGYRFVALGHHQGDQLETFFAHLFRGAGPEGLKGMRLLSAQKYFRPLLHLTREEIAAYLARRSLPYRVDASNAQRDYLRNRLRQDLLPAIRTLAGAHAARNVVKTMDILAADADLLERLAQREYASVVRPVPHGGSEVDLAVLKRLPRALQRRLLRRCITSATSGHVPSFPLVEELLELALAGASGGSLDLGRGVRAVKVYEKLMVGGRVEEPDPLARVELAPGARLSVPEWGLSIEVDELLVADLVARLPGVFHADRDSLRFPLVMRRPQRGDRIAPLGLQGHHKTLSRWFKDAKVPAPERSTTLVLADREKVIWVVGRLVSEECRITPVTKAVLRVKVSPLPGA